MLIFVLWYSFEIRPIMLFALDEDKCVCCSIHDELQRPIHHYWICQINAILDIPSCSAANGRKATNTCSPLSIRDTTIFNDFAKFNDIHPSSNSSIKSSWILTYKANVTYRIIQWLSWITMFWSWMGRFATNCQGWHSHEWQLLANHLTSDQKRQPVLILFLTCISGSRTQRNQYNLQSINRRAHVYCGPEVYGIVSSGKHILWRQFDLLASECFYVGHGCLPAVVMLIITC